MKEREISFKNIFFGLLATASFVMLLLFCMDLQAKGIPFLVGLIVHTCSLLLLYYCTLIAPDPEDWPEEDTWAKDLENTKESFTEHDVARTEAPPYHIPEANAFEDADGYTKVHKTAKQLKKEEEQAVTENFFKNVYAEVRESLIDSSDRRQELVEEIADEISSETLLPAPQEGTVAATVIPDALYTFLSRPKNIVEMDLIAAAKDAMESLTPFAEAEKIKLHLSTTCDSLTMMADPDSIRILFRNIIDNSIKYMGRPGHMIITISLLADDIFLILKDTGKGLSEDETEHVFELNFQGSNRVSGNGLGLTQTKMIVEAFGGTIYAKSSPGNGMAIYIQLPVSGSATS